MVNVLDISACVKAIGLPKTVAFMRVRIAAVLVKVGEFVQKSIAAVKS